MTNVKTTDKKNTAKTAKKNTAKKSTASTAKKSTEKRVSKVASATADKSYSLVARNDGRTRVVNSKGITVCTYWGSKTLTFLTASDDVKKSLMSAYKFNYKTTDKHGNNKHLLTISATKDITIENILKTVFKTHSKSKDDDSNLKKGEEVEKTTKKSTAKKSGEKKSSTAKKSGEVKTIIPPTSDIKEVVVNA